MERVDLGFTQLEVGVSSALVRTREGVDVTVELHRSMVCEIESRVAGDYGVILDDVNSYSLRFGTLIEIRTNPRIKCIAVVAYRASTYEIAELAGSCIEKPLRIFSSPQTAHRWIEQQLLHATH